MTAAAHAGSSNSEAREALALWRGGALADVADEPFAAAEIRRLEELRELDDALGDRSYSDVCPPG